MNTQFDYLLNAVERAAQEAHPAKSGYAGKRKALFAYVRELEAKVAPHPAPAAPSDGKWVPMEPTPEMVAAIKHVIPSGAYDFVAISVWKAMLAAAPASLESGLVGVTMEPLNEAEMVCAEAYQVVGSLLSDLGKFETPEAQKILDNLSAARRVHLDVLPWESYEVRR